ncbi:MAG: sugar ABC transporter permease [Chlamydiota bacterium]|nr:sugar ABC transporter permease [Chlamydiota bacterium]
MKAKNLSLMPVLIIFILFGIVPVFYSGFMSFQGIWLKTPWLNKSFVYFDNYRLILTDPQCYQALWHTLGFVLITLGIEVSAGFCLAYALFRATMGKHYLIQLGLFLPLATPAVLSAQMWRLFFHDSQGLLNRVLEHLHMISQQIPWLSEPVLAWFTIGVAELWKVTPFVTVVLLSSLLNIPRQTWEAAYLDGAKGWKCIRFIAIPLIRKTILVIILFRMLDAIRVFDLVYVMTQGGPGGATDVLGLFVYRALFSEMAMGKASAASIIMIGLAGVLALIIFLVYRKYTKDYE